MMHHLWNQLPALQLLAASTPLPKHVDIDILFEPFGPTSELFPELEGNLRSLSYQEAVDRNDAMPLSIGIGGWTITAELQARVGASARRLASAQSIRDSDNFAAKHQYLFWLSVKPPNRTIHQQPNVVAGLIASLKRQYPSAGFLLDGTSRPWDYATNANYLQWFRTYFERSSRESAELAREILDVLPESVRCDVRVLNDITLADEIIWGRTASFYICHGGSMQNKIAWVHGTSGVIHSNEPFVRSAKAMPAPVVPEPAISYISRDALSDDGDEGYDALALSRKDKNYSVTSVERLSQEVVKAFESAIQGGHLSSRET